MRVFRDETNIGAQDLSLQIEDALNKSRFLILLASPTACRSKWVNKEIGHFVRKHGVRSLCIVLTDGLTPWTSKAYDASSPKAAIPKELQREFGENQPLVIDLSVFRGMKKPRGEEYLRSVAGIVACLSGREKDAVYGEHLTRQRRIKAALRAAIVVFVALVGLVGSLIYAVRDERKQKAVAETDAKNQHVKTVEQSDAIKRQEDKVARLSEQTIKQEHEAARRREAAKKQTAEHGHQARVDQANALAVAAHDARTRHDELAAIALLSAARRTATTPLVIAESWMTPAPTFVFSGTLGRPNIQHITHSFDRTLLALSYGDDTVDVLNAASGKRLRQIKSPTPIGALAFDPRGLKLAIGSRVPNSDPQQVEIDSPRRISPCGASRPEIAS